MINFYYYLVPKIPRYVRGYPMNYRTRIKNLREDNDKTQQQIADYLGTSQTMYARYERGANEMPLRHLIRLARYYNVDMNYLCGLSNIKNPYPKR